MDGIFFDYHDLSLLLAIKPLMSFRGQKTIDVFLNMMEVINNSKLDMKEIKDTFDIQSINKLIRTLNQE